MTLRQQRRAAASCTDKRVARTQEDALDSTGKEEIRDSRAPQSLLERKEKTVGHRDMATKSTLSTRTPGSLLVRVTHPWNHLVP